MKGYSEKTPDSSSRDSGERKWLETGYGEQRDKPFFLLSRITEVMAKPVHITAITLMAA